MVNGSRDFWRIVAAALAGAAVLCLTAWCRGAEYDEQYTLFLTAGVPRPDWPSGVFAAGLARTLQAGHTSLAAIGRDLRSTDVHPPLYFWMEALWRGLVGPGLFAARLASVLMGTGTLILTGMLAARAGVAPLPAMAITLGCYGFAYTSAIARGFALAMPLTMGGAVLLQARPGAARAWLAGVMLGAATFSNYLSVFGAAAVLVTAGRARAWPAAGFALFLPADLWWFLAQRGSREGQFPAFHWLAGLARLANRLAGAVLGGLPLYLPSPVSGAVTIALAAFLAALVWTVARRWRGPWLPPLAVLATPAGLLALGLVFDTTPIELRYLTFSLPFLGVLLAGVLGPRMRCALLAVQALSIAGLIAAPATMQPARAAAHAAAALASDGVVLLPRGNDGVGIAGAFAIEAPPALPLLLLPAGEDPARLAARLAPFHRVTLAAIVQDEASRAAVETARAILSGPTWREVAREGLTAVYERRADGG